MAGYTSETWAPLNGPIAQHVHLQSQMCLLAYQVNPSLVLEHANIERATAQGGYGRRQLYELVQNGADALIGSTGIIHVVLTDDALYCANEGMPIDEEGATALLQSYISMKRGQEIGRFGLGFKSVLGVTDCPEFYSRSGSFVFDARASEREIRAVVGDVDRVPFLRIAQAVAAAAGAQADPILEELMEWATTIVKLPGGARSAPWLIDDIVSFPGEFLLFVPHVSELVLEDRRLGTVREIRLTEAGDEFVLSEPGSTARWKVFHTRHAPSEKARGDAGELAEREDIPIVWAVPMEGQLREGAFWAFFPTESRTTLSGILNAPWKTNEDRQNLLRGDFNNELLDVAAELIADAIPSLSSPDDPSRYLDLLPARGREARNWADERISDVVYQTASLRPCLPDQSGTLRDPADLEMAPGDVPGQALSRWEEFEDRPTSWVHHSAERRERAPRALRLLNAADERGRSSLVNWLEALVDSRSTEASCAAIRVAAAVADDADDRRMAELRRARIVLTEDGELVDLRTGSAFLPGEYRPSSPLVFVHTSLAESTDTRSCLLQLGIGPVAPESELEGMLARGDAELSDWGQEEWVRFWELARRIDVERAAVIIMGGTLRRPAAAIRAKTIAGTFRPLHRVLLPGPIVPRDGSRDASAAVDTSFHGEEIELLERLGAVASPVEWTQAESEPWFSEYRFGVVDEYFGKLPAGGSRPLDEYLVFDSTRTVGPLSPIRELSDQGRLRFSEALLDSSDEPAQWEMSHRTRSSYPTLSVDGPAIWMLRREGRLSTSLGPRPIDGVVGPGLERWQHVLPVARRSLDEVLQLNLPNTLGELLEHHWEESLEAVGRLSNDLEVGSFYAAAAEFVDAPALVRCRVGQSHDSRPADTVTVTADPYEFRTLIEEGRPAVRVGAKAERDRLEQAWGMLAPDVRRRTRHVPSSPSAPLLDEYQALEWFAVDLDGWTLQRCSELSVETLSDSVGGRQQYLSQFEIEEKTIFVSDQLTDREFLERLGEDGRFDLGADDIEDVLSRRRDEEQVNRLAEIRERGTDGERLAAAVGADALRRQLPDALVKAVEAIHGTLDDDRLGELAIAMYGSESLSVLKDELDQAQLSPPAQWAGSQAALRFVRDLGFPPEYAGTRGAVREPLLQVDGPTELPALHPYQRTIANEVRELLARSENRRALIALPTGAGKTRVAVQAIVEAVREDGFGGLVLWVADRDELCEQAVQSWSEVWHSLGTDGRLYISRHWGRNEATPMDGGFQVVVATIQKLQGTVGNSDYEWLSDAACIVVDEAHGSIGPQHTEFLQWVGLGRSQARDRATLLGLTATPYRGVSQDETQRLVSRYGGRRLDVEALGEEPERALQEMGVLSRVDHELLPGDDVELTSEELEQLQRLRQLPRGVEARLGTSVSRNVRLLDSIKKLPRDWPVLFFATSVDHAQTMAALLTLEGIRAAAVSADTSPASRRYYVERFRNNEIQVLTNYGVLTQGFDAPSTRAVYIARPTYSPNLYQQMIGRGLRGPLNGGKERCLVVNVEDNVRQYGEALAFHDFDHLWNAS